ncbi:polysaccharide deacetylase family protein [Anaerobacillus sp. MEB173]|uniref:polysaccharide deacetylase family protein n=1 Tax=Anaerobacillus sp. MEB173 TaxID=3383345 RepID=UPI003F92196D
MKSLIIHLLFLSFLIGCSSEAIYPDSDNPNEEKVVIEEVNEGESKDVSQKEIIDVSDDQKLTEEDNGSVESEFTYKINQANWTLDPVNHDKNQVVLLTIDDAPDQYSVDMAHILHELGVDAIFFVNGHFLNTDEKKKSLQEIYELGFEIGNHTMTHPNLSKLSKEEQQKQIIELNDLIEEIIGERPRFFRAPFGVNTEESIEIVANEEMQYMNWTYGYDWEKEYLDAEKLADIMVNTNLLRNGAILLMHDREWSKDALVDIINGLQEKGYGFVDPKHIE